MAADKIKPAKPSAKIYPVDLRYLAERIGELNKHAALHEGELCAKLARARIGGMVEVLNRMDLEVKANWTRPDRNVVIVTDLELQEEKAKARLATT